MNIDPSKLDAGAMNTHAANAHKLQGEGVGSFILNIIPTTSVDALARNDVLQVLFFAIVFGITSPWSAKRVRRSPPSSTRSRPCYSRRWG